LFSILEAKEECCLPMELRKKTLEQLDEWINRVTPLPVRTFPPIPSDITQVYQDPILELQTFSEDYGFFSCQKPLVGVVTEESSDIQIVEKALACLLMSNNPSFIELATGEILSKVLAYRGLQKGMIIRIPCIIEDKALLVDYEVAEILDLWLEMPAFGLLPLHKKANPILLFRGSDFSLISKKSWASLLSDLDVSGTGFSAFHLARTDIHAFLKKATLSSGNKTKVMGFSLGGILAMYTTIFEKPFIALQGSMAFNPPGFSKTISERWKEVSSLLKIYITQGDLIPKLGILAAPAFVLFTDQNFGPIEAHTLLMTAEPSFYLSEIHIENKLNKK
jgi:hypothetical protein